MVYQNQEKGFVTRFFVGASFAPGPVAVSSICCKTKTKICAKVLEDFQGDRKMKVRS